ncbi:MAG: Na+/H+ antiporter NhaC family protein, partial [bacterium]
MNSSFKQADLIILSLVCNLFILTKSVHSQAEAIQNVDTGRVLAKFNLHLSHLALKGVTFHLTVDAVRRDGSKATSYSGSVNIDGLSVKSETGAVNVIHTIKFKAGTATIANAVFQNTGVHSIRIESNEITATGQVRVIPGFLSLLPPLFAIVLAFMARQVLLSLFCGVWLGSIFIYNFNPLLGFMKTIDTYLINSLADADHAAILIFSLTLGGMVGVMSKAGGTQGIVQKLSKYANHPRGGQLATWAMGVFIFFDDYANTLIVGNTMRPFTDRLKISREKLSYIVDSTAAPVASIALVSTWIGFQIGLIDQAFNVLNLSHNAYNIFLQSIPFATYSILA